MMSWMEKREKRSQSKEEEDEEACLYAFLLSGLQVFPSILNAAIDLNLFEILSQRAYLSVAEIASQLPTTEHPELHNRLDRMLRVLASFSVLDCTTRIKDHDDGDATVERPYSLSLAGKYFLKTEPENFAFFSNLSCHPAASMAIIHNWSDEKCVTLLKNCYKSLPENGKVIVMDMIMPEESDSSDATKVVSMSDNAMFIQAGGKERTEKEFEKLCKDSGFSSSLLVSRALSVFGVIEFFINKSKINRVCLNA